MITHYGADLGNIGLWWTCVAVLIFVTQYSVLDKWWKNPFGITIVGLDLGYIGIYWPSIVTLAASFFHKSFTFAGTRWYFWESVTVVTASAIFVTTRIVAWEITRRERDVFSRAKRRERDNANH